MSDFSRDFVRRRRRAGTPPRRKVWRRTGFFRPIGEALEPRTLLAAVSVPDAYGTIAPDWFTQIPVSLGSQSSHSFIGPVAIAVGTSGGNWQSDAEVAQWIVRLTPEASQRAGSVAGAENLLNSSSITFHVLKGLGLPGQVLIESSADAAESRAALASDPDISHFEPNA